MITSDHDLLRQFSQNAAQDAFTALVKRHLNLVYSAALRQVRSPQLAEEVAQSVFVRLAAAASGLSPDMPLSAWLYRVACNAAVDVVRREARRQAREQIALQMSETNTSSTEWTHIEPLLDDAMKSLADTDRTAVLLRFFENKSLREVGQALGTSEDAAQKRVSRALEELRAFFSKRKIPVGTGSLAALVSANAVQAAPSGLVSTVAAGALAGSSALSTITTATLGKTLLMTTVQKTLLAAVVAGGIVAGVYETRQMLALQHEVKTLRQQQEQQSALSNQMANLQRERDHAASQAAALAAENAALKKQPKEVLKLRGQVGRLRQEKEQADSAGALVKAANTPESRELMRDQQKQSMRALYRKLAQQLKLPAEQTEKLNGLLADNVMANMDLAGRAQRDKLAPDQIETLFSEQDASLHQQLWTLLGPDGATAYQDYSRNLLGSLASQELSSGLSGPPEQKAEKTRLLSEAFQEASQASLSDAGLPADYQTMPLLNFRNVASPQQGERSIRLMQDIYERAAARSQSFLSEQELARLQETKAKAAKGYRSVLSINGTVATLIAR